MKKILLFITIILSVLSINTSVFAVQENSGSSKKITDTTLTMTVVFDKASTGATQITLYACSVSTVKEDCAKKSLAKTVNTVTTSPANVNLDISNLAHGPSKATSYNLLVVDNTGGDTIWGGFVTSTLTSEGTGSWYYTSSAMIDSYATTDPNQSFGRYTTQALCKTALLKAVDTVYLGSYKREIAFTDCFNSSKKPTVSEFKSRYVNYPSFNSSKPFYYFTYYVKGDYTWNRSEGFVDESSCIRNKDSDPKISLIDDCKALPKPPIQPDNWNNLIKELASGKSYIEAQQVVSNVKKTFSNDYTPLAPIPGLRTTVNDDNALGSYLNAIFKFAIALCGALAVIMITMAGIQMMGSESIFGKVEAKGKIYSAIAGLLLALGAYAILNTINPKLIGGSLNINPVSVKLTPRSGGGEFGLDIGKSNTAVNITAYDGFLKSAGQKYGVQCTLIKAFMYAESGGKNSQTSSAGAKGLMQLMPATYKEQGYDVATMMDPETNILAGAKYISTLQKTGCNTKQSTDNPYCSTANIQYLAASYNGGPGANALADDCKNVTNWQCTEYPGYAQTRTYAPRVEANFNKLKEKGWGCD